MVAATQPALAFPPAARVVECGLPPARYSLGPESFTRFWRASRQGLTGGDAAFSARLPDDRILWAFGDSFVGGLRPDGTRPLETPVVRNMLAIEDGDCLTTVFRGSPAWPLAYLPAPENPYLGWYWPNQPYIHGRHVLMFLTHLHRTDPSGWGFVADGTAIATLRLPDLGLVNLEPVRVAKKTYLGVAVLGQGRSMTVFGVDERRPGRRGLLVARMTHGRWRFWSRRGWSRRPGRGAPVLALPSSQFSVLRRGKGLVLVAKDGMAPGVLSFTAPRPTGPWTPAGLAAWIPPLAGLLTYNAALHPEFGGGHRPLLSYSVTHTELTFEGIDRRPWNYLPRFTTALLPP